MSDVHAPSHNPIFDPVPLIPARRVYTFAGGSDEIPWSHGGTVNPGSTETGEPWPAPFNLTLDRLYLTLAGASNVTLSVGTNVNGVLITTKTIGAGPLIVVYALGISMAQDATLQPTLLAAPTGTGVGLGVIYRYSRA